MKPEELAKIKQQTDKLPLDELHEKVVKTAAVVDDLQQNIIGT